MKATLKQNPVAKLYVPFYPMKTSLVMKYTLKHNHEAKISVPFYLMNL